MPNNPYTAAALQERLSNLSSSQNIMDISKITSKLAHEEQQQPQNAKENNNEIEAEDSAEDTLEKPKTDYSR